MKKDYTIRKKRIWKGKFAPQGFMFIVLDLKVNKTKYTNVVAVRGGITEEQENEIGKKLRKGIEEKYHV